MHILTLPTFFINNMLFQILEYPAKALPSESIIYGASSARDILKNNNSNKNLDDQFINSASDSQAGQDDRLKHQRTHGF